MLAVPWQTDTAPEGVVGTPGRGFTVTVSVEIVLVPQALVDVTPTVAVPEKAGSQLMVPVVPVPEAVPLPRGEMLQLYVVALVAVVV